MQYKVIDTKSPHFGRILDFEACSDLSDVGGGVILKTKEQTYSLFRFNEVEKIDSVLAS